MGFLLRFIGLVLLLNSITLSAVLFYRALTPPYLQDLLHISEDCGDRCWFGFLPDGTTIRREAEAQITSAGAGTISTRGSNMRFNLFEENSPDTIGTLSVTLDEGYAIEFCYFPGRNSVVLGDILASFGEPDTLWILAFADDEYEMVYESQIIIIRGSMRFDPQQDFNDTIRLDIMTPVTEICATQTLPEVEFFEAVTAPSWAGFAIDISHYCFEASSHQICNRN